jgi:hypothetical protein
MKLTASCRAALFAAAAALSTVPAAGAQDVPARPADQPAVEKPASEKPATTTASADAQQAGPAQPAETPAAQPAQSPVRQWPWYSERRFEENWEPPDWSNRNRGARDIFDKIKAIPLEKNGWAYISFGGQARARYARQSTVTYGGPFEFQPVMWTYMFRTHADLHIGPHLRAFGELIYSHSSINGFRLGSNTDHEHKNGEFLNAFGEYSTKIKKYQTTFWAGRRELLMGKERILSPGNWLLNRHTYDGMGGYSISPKGKRFEGFLVRPRLPVPDVFNRRDDTTTFWGFFYTSNIVRQPKNADGTAAGSPRNLFFQPYLLRIKRKAITFVQGTADEDRYTTGMLLYGDVGGTGLDFEFEGAYQYGRYRSVFGETGRIHAAMGTIETGYRFKTIRLQPRLSASFDYATGDRDQEDTQLNTFDPLYPLAWSFFGFHAAFERKNLMIGGVKLEANLRKNTFFKATYWPGIYRAQAADGAYDSFGNISRRPEPQSRGGSTIDLERASRKIGSQMDVGVAYIPSHHLLFYATYLHFFPGDFISQTQTTPKHPMNGVMALAQFNF